MKRRKAMLTEKAVEMLSQTISNMKEINEHYQPVNGTDTDVNQMIRVMAQSIALLCHIALEIDTKEREALKAENEEIEAFLKRYRSEQMEGGNIS